MRLKGLCLALLLISGCDRAPDTVAEKSSGEKAANPALGARWQYPREREIDGRRVIVHAPQIRTWDRFEHFTAQVAIESLERDAAASYGVLDISGDTVLDRQARLVKVAKPKVDRVTISGGGSKEQEDRIRAALEREPSRFHSTFSCITWRMACWNQRRPRDSTRMRRQFTSWNRPRSCSSSTAKR